MDPFRQTNNKGFANPVFFKLLTRFWCLNVRKFRQKSIGEGFKLIEWYWPSYSQAISESEEAVQYLSNIIWPIFAFILFAAEVSPYTNMGNFRFNFIGSWSFPLYKFWTRCCIKIPLHLGTRNESIAWKTREVRNFCRGLAGGG